MQRYPVHRVAQAHTSPLRAYRQRVVGSARFSDLLKYEALTSCLGNFPGGLGIWLRARLYPLIFRSMAPSAFIGPGVTLRNPGQISLGARTYVDSFSYLEGVSDAPEGGIYLGERNYVYSFCVISAAYHGYVRTGKNCSFNPGTQIFGTGGVDIGDNVMVAGLTTLIAYAHEFDALDTPMIEQPITGKGIRVGSNVWIGAQATILDGVTIGTGAVVGAGSVVTHDVPEDTVVAGVPARPLRKRGSGRG